MTSARVRQMRSLKGQFHDYLGCVYINSKEKGGHYCLADGLYTAQKRFIDFIFDGLEEDIHDFKFLKSRQLGVSTISRALDSFWLGIHDGMQGAVVFDTDGHKEEARLEIREMILGLPKSVKFPTTQGNNRYLMSMSNGSKIRFMAAGVRGSRSGGTLGRSSGINMLHASEICSWDNDEGLKSLQAALSRNFPERLYIYESTARGYNIWYDMWAEARSDDLNQRTLFLGWWAKDDQIIARGTRRFEKYGTDPPTVEEQERIEAVERQYGWRVTDEQLAWYREYMDPNKEREAGDPEDTIKVQEQPWTEEESFQKSGSSFFPAESLKRAQDALQGVKPISQWRFFPGTDFLATSFQPAHTLREVDLKVWEEPVPGAQYVVSADPAYGHSELNDRSACNVLRCYADGVDQVAEFASPITATYQFAWLIASLVGWYCLGGANPVVPIIELNGPGDAVWREYYQLQKVVQNGYLRAEAKERGLQNIFTNVRQYIYSRSDAMTPGSSYHWKTSGPLKVAIMERLRDAVQSGSLLVRSVDTLQEMESVVRSGDAIGAEGHRHDDRVFTLAMGIRAWEEKLRPALINRRQTREAEHARVSLTPEARYNLFTKHTIETMFAAKRRANVGRMVEERKMLWRFK